MLVFRLESDCSNRRAGRPLLAHSGTRLSRGLRPASISATAVLPPAVALGSTQHALDDRHGLLRAADALLLLMSLPQSGEPQPPRGSKTEGSSISSMLVAQRKPRGLKRTALQRATSSSPTRGPASSAAASVTLAAGAAGAAGTASPAAAARSAAAAAAANRPLQQMLAGGLAGVISKTLVAPLERVSTMLMADGGQRFGLREAVAAAWRQGGVAGLYRGNAATLAKIFPASAIQFAVFHGLKDAMLAARAKHAATDTASSLASGRASSSRSGAGSSSGGTGASGELSNAERLVAGAAAGAASVAVTYPLESARTLMSVAGGMEGSLVSVCRSVVARGGVRALYRGFRATLAGDTLGNALGFLLYELANSAYKELHGGRSAPPPVRGLLGSLSAACTLTLTMPMEVVRRRLQVQGTLGRPVLYRGTLDCVRQILRKEGMAGFYRASLPSFLKVAPSIGCMYFLYEVLTRHLPPAEPAVAAGPTVQLSAASSAAS